MYLHTTTTHGLSWTNTVIFRGFWKFLLSTYRRSSRPRMSYSQIPHLLLVRSRMEATLQKTIPMPWCAVKRWCNLPTPQLTWCAASIKRASSISRFYTTPISPRSSARMRAQFCSRSKPRESPFLCAPTMSIGMKLLRFSARFCGATPPRIARKSPICLPPINSAQHPQQIRIAKAFSPAQPIWYYCNGLLLAIHKVLLHAEGFNV